MVKAYIQIAGVQGNSKDAAHLNWIEIHKLDVDTDWNSKPSTRSPSGWVRPIRVDAWTLLGPHSGDLRLAHGMGKDLDSAVLEVMKSSNSPIVLQRIRMKSIRVVSYDLNRDPGLAKPVSHFVLVTENHTYEVGSAVKQNLIHEPAHATSG